MLGAVTGHPPETRVPPHLADATTCTGAFAAGAGGASGKLGAGVCAGGRMTPGGARRICTDSGLTVPKFVLVGVAMTNTHVPGKPLHVPYTPFDGLGGAVYTTDAWPSLPVTIVRADNVPKSPGWPATLISRRIGSAATPRPSGPTANTLIAD